MEKRRIWEPIILVVLIVGGLYLFNLTKAYGFDNPYAKEEGSSKYDQKISKYDISQKLFRYRIAEDKRYGGYYCEETSLKEKEAIISDIKSGRMGTKRNPDFRSAIYISNDFKNSREYLYFGYLYDCETFIDKNYNKNYRYRDPR